MVPRFLLPGWRHAGDNDDQMISFPLHPPQVKGDLAKLQLTSPVCTKEGEKIALSRRVEKHWRLIGWGQIQKGLSISMPGRQ